MNTPFKVTAVVKRIAKVSLWLAGLVLGTLLAYVLIEHFSGAGGLNSRMKELSAKGETLDYRKLVPPKTPPEQNVALDLLALTNELQKFSGLSRIAPSMMKMTGPGLAIVSWKTDMWVSEKETNSWAEYGPEVLEAAPTLDRLQSIWNKTGYDEGLDYARGLIDFPVMPLLAVEKQTSMLLAGEVGEDLHEEMTGDALNHLRSLLTLVNAMGKEPLLISQLVRIACGSYAVHATWEALQATNWTDGQLADTQAAWQTNDFLSPMRKSLEMERALTVDYYRQIRSSRATAVKAIDQGEQLQVLLGGTNLPLQQFVSRYIHLPAWQVLWAGQDELRSLDQWQARIAGSRAKSWLEAQKCFPTEDSKATTILAMPDDKLTRYDRVRFLFSQESFSYGSNLILKFLKMETEKNMVVTAIALRRYELRHKMPAQELAVLVPEFLAEIPLDRMDGKPLRYHLNAEGGFKLYSVGMNTTDEGGNPQPPEKVEKYNNIWLGRDVVWPVAVPAVAKR